MGQGWRFCWSLRTFGESLETEDRKHFEEDDDYVVVEFMA